MKKHIFGFMLFSLIVASFVVVYAFFYAPSIPSPEAVKPPVPRTETRAEKPFCYPKRSKDFSYEVESANYYAEQGKLVTKVRIHWNGRGDAPKKISVQPRILTADNYGKNLALKAETFFAPFTDGNDKMVTIESKFVLDGVGSGPPNLYVALDFADALKGIALSSEKAGLSEAHHILYVFPESSQIKPKVRGRLIPVED
jgi:hypothetical protein